MTGRSGKDKAGGRSGKAESDRGRSVAARAEHARAKSERVAASAGRASASRAAVKAATRKATTAKRAVKVDTKSREAKKPKAAETINSSLDSGALETTILGEAARLTGAGAAALLVPRGDVLVAREALGIGDRARDSFVVPLETSVFGRALVSGEDRRRRARGAGNRRRGRSRRLRRPTGRRAR